MIRLVFLLSLWIFNANSASACSCLADPLSKTYQLIEETWYGTKRKWSCEYLCIDTQDSQHAVIGYHQDWYFGRDEGLEGICDGLQYSKQYIPSRDNFVWVLQQANYFNPKKSSSRELREFSKNFCR